MRATKREGSPSSWRHRGAGYCIVDLRGCSRGGCVHLNLRRECACAAVYAFAVLTLHVAHIVLAMMLHFATRPSRPRIEGEHKRE